MRLDLKYWSDQALKTSKNTDLLFVKIVRFL